MEEIMNKYLAFALLFIGFSYISNAAQKNYLSTDFYGFEDGGKAIYIQHPDNWSISNEKAATGGSYSMKFTSPVAVDGQKKANGGSNGSKISFPAGTYTFKVKVWLDPDADISGFIFVLKNPWTNIPFNFNALERGKWVELNMEKTFTNDVTDSDCLFKVDQSHGGKGTFYIDDLEIWGENNEPIVLPYISSIATTNDVNISLPAGVYDVKMQVWVDHSATFSSFHTMIEEPWTPLKWHIDNISKGTWVELNQKMTLNTDVQNSPFKIQLCNNPEYGGGTGLFYIDDIEFVRENSLGVNQIKAFHCNVFPNPASDYLSVESEVSSEYLMYNISGNIVKSSNEKEHSFVIPLSGVNPGMYLLQLKSNKGSVVEQIIIQ